MRAPTRLIGAQKKLCRREKPAVATNRGSKGYAVEGSIRANGERSNDRGAVNKRLNNKLLQGAIGVSWTQQRCRGIWPMLNDISAKDGLMSFSSKKLSEDLKGAVMAGRRPPASRGPFCIKWNSG
jgi:hypothetical protein